MTKLTKKVRHSVEQKRHVIADVMCYHEKNSRMQYGTLRQLTS
jgi:hypothetical protein